MALIGVLAEDAYGPHLAKNVILYPRHKLGKASRVGETVFVTGKSGKIRAYTILKLHQGLVSLDGNHPLAGRDLIFEIEVLDVREATAAELAQTKNFVSSQIFH